MFAKCDCLRYLRNALLVALALWGIHWAWYWLAERIMAQSPQTKLPDALEASGALFSGLAVLAAVCTLWVQRADLELQRQELKNTREEIKGQKKQMELQTETFSRQAFENTLFKLIGMKVQYLASLNINGNPGVKSIAVMLEEFEGSIMSATLYPSEDDYRKLSKAYTDILRIKYKELLTYINIVWLVMFNIENEKSINDDDKANYFRILKMQFSVSEADLLIKHVALSAVDNGMLEIAEKYQLFETIHPRGINKAILGKYRPSAFGLVSWGESPLTPPPRTQPPADTPGQPATPESPRAHRVRPR